MPKITSIWHLMSYRGRLGVADLSELYRSPIRVEIVTHNILHSPARTLYDTAVIRVYFKFGNRLSATICPVSGRHRAKGHSRFVPTLEV